MNKLSKYILLVCVLNVLSLNCMENSCPKQVADFNRNVEQNIQNLNENMKKNIQDLRNSLEENLQLKLSSKEIADIEKKVRLAEESQNPKIIQETIQLIEKTLPSTPPYQKDVLISYVKELRSLIKQPETITTETIYLDLSQSVRLQNDIFKELEKHTKTKEEEAVLQKTKEEEQKTLENLIQNYISLKNEKENSVKKTQDNVKELEEKLKAAREELNNKQKSLDCMREKIDKIESQGINVPKILEEQKEIESKLMRCILF